MTRETKRTSPLKEIRRAAGYTQVGFARHCNIPLRTIQEYEYQKRNINGAKLETLCTMALALDCKVYDLLTDEDTKEMLKQTT